MDTKTTRLPQIPRAPVVVSPRSDNIQSLTSGERGLDVSMLQPSSAAVESSTRSAAWADGARNLSGTGNQEDADVDEEVASLHSAMMINLEAQQYNKHCTKCNKVCDGSKDTV